MYVFTDNSRVNFTLLMVVGQQRSFGEAYFLHLQGDGIKSK